MQYTSRILVIGASGYIGGRLIPLLEQTGRPVRCLARDVSKLKSAVRDGTEVVKGDVLDPPSLEDAMREVHTVYYLVHLMATSSKFEEDDRRAAENVAAAATRAGVKRIIYLGGLGDENTPDLSPHLRSRQEVGRIFRASGVPTIELRASVILGEGSLSFEIIKSLTERLPVMLCPTWLKTPTQPIAIEDVLAYLLAAKDLPETVGSEVIEIGGADVVTYADMIREYARQRGLRRALIFVPVLTPGLSGMWLAIVTPAAFEVGKHLIEGLRNPTVVTKGKAKERFPKIEPMGLAEAMTRAIAEGN